MTTVHLIEPWIDRLVHLPETGMGYQKVDIVLKGGRVLKDVVVFNAEECQVSEAFEPVDVTDVRLAH